MDVTPLSMQMVVPRVSDAQQVQHNLNQASAMQQDFEALREKAAANRTATQVRTSTDAAAGKIKENPGRQREQGGYSGRQDRQEEEQDEAQEEAFAVDPARGHHLDISL